MPTLLYCNVSAARQTEYDIIAATRLTGPDTVHTVLDQNGTLRQDEVLLSASSRWSDYN
jgi:hypothetical protein